MQQTYNGYTGPIVATAVLPDQRILSVSIDGTVKVWPADGGAQGIALRRHSMQVSAIAFSPDGRWPASGSLAGIVETGNLKLWNARTNEFLREFPGHHGKIQSLAFSPYLASGKVRQSPWRHGPGAARSAPMVIGWRPSLPTAPR